MFSLYFKIYINMTFPPHIYNPYNLIDLYEIYTKYQKKSKLFRETFTSFKQFIICHKKLIKRNIFYLHLIQNESRKYHKLYD